MCPEDWAPDDPWPPEDLVPRWPRLVRESAVLPADYPNGVIEPPGSHQTNGVAIVPTDRTTEPPYPPNQQRSPIPPTPQILPKPPTPKTNSTFWVKRVP